MAHVQRQRVGLCAAFWLVFALCEVVPAAGGGRPTHLRFQVQLPASAKTLTGRVFVMISRDQSPEPRLQAGSAPFFGVDVVGLQPGGSATLDETALGYPVASLRQIPTGDYYVQALANVYTEFHRADGHTIWAHMDQWEGQQFNRSPGNLYSTIEKLHLDPAVGYDVKLNLTETIPPVRLPPDTEWVKHIKIESPLLTKFWGHPMYLGATVLLPKDYAQHPELHYPVLYFQDHFSLEPPLFFSTEQTSEDDTRSAHDYGWQSGYEFYESWNSAHFPRMLIVTFQHPTPYFDDSYAVNSANNGPYGDAIMKELIPYVEEHFRIIRKPYARVLSGGSTGGWESLALQIYHPDFFGGTWTFFPDPVDFRRYDMVNIYDDSNAFVEPGHDWTSPERYIMRKPDGQPEISVREYSQYEEVQGSHGRSGSQLEAWEAVYGPVGSDGYPKPLWDKQTGTIDRTVADYMRDHGYDLRYYLAEHWARVGPQLAGKLHLFVGDMDNYYLNLAVYLLQDFLKDTQDPHVTGNFEYGRPMKGHGWTPLNQSELVRAMAKEVAANAAETGDGAPWLNE